LTDKIVCLRVSSKTVAVRRWKFEIQLIKENAK
jgi:hypothetical protein